MSASDADINDQAGEGNYGVDEKGMAFTPGESSRSQDVAQRMLIWTADLSVEVKDLEESVQKAISLAETRGGFVAIQRNIGESSAYLSIRVPATAFRDGLADFEALGKVIRRNIHGVDVTDQMVDIQARMKTKIALRDRLTEHLSRTESVADIIAIETQLQRIQADIESMEARLRTLSGQVEYATVNLTLERRIIYGPLGYPLKALGWAIEKLFVIRY